MASDQISTLYMVLAQMDRINTHVLDKLRDMVLKQLHTLMMSPDLRHWCTVYFVVFILLHEVAVSLAY